MYSGSKCFLHMKFLRRVCFPECNSFVHELLVSRELSSSIDQRGVGGTISRLVLGNRCREGKGHKLNTKIYTAREPLLENFMHAPNKLKSRIEL